MVSCERRELRGLECGRGLCQSRKYRKVLFCLVSGLGCIIQYKVQGVEGWGVERAAYQKKGSMKFQRACVCLVL